MIRIHIHHHYPQGDTELLPKINLILENQTKIMGAIEDLNAKIAEIQTSLDAEQEAIKAAIEGLTAQIAALNELLSTGATAEQIQSAIAALDAIKTDLEGTV